MYVAHQSVLCFGIWALFKCRSNARFSDIDTTPHPEQYIPMVFTGITDRNEKEVWESDLVSFDFSGFIGNSPGGLIQCVVVYDETLAIFGLKPLEMSDNSATVPLMGLKDMIEVVGNVYEGMG